MSESNRNVAAWIAAVLLAAAGTRGCDCGSPAATDPCAGVDCSGAGECHVAPDGTTPYCACDPGYHPTADLRGCVPNDAGDPCAGVQCGGHGTCRVDDDLPTCDCDPGYTPDESGLVCLPPPPADGGDGDDAGEDGAADGDGDGDEADVDAEGDADGRWWSIIVTGPPIDRVDILLVIDSSASMLQEHAVLAERVQEMVVHLLDPPDEDGDTRPDHPAVEDLNIGFTSADMGTMGFSLPGCLDPVSGDDGCLLNNPYPSASECEGRSFPLFLSRNASNADTYTVEQMGLDAACLVRLGTNGCGLEQPFEAARKALVEDAGGCNAGFQRAESLLSIIWVVDENDCSVDPEHPELCDPARMDLGHLNVRCAQHPELLRSVGFYDAALVALRGGRKEDIVLGMIVGVPPDAPECIGFGHEIDDCLAVPAMAERVDPDMPSVVVPSCESAMGSAQPPVRFVELARLWGRSAAVDSICKTDWTEALHPITQRIVDRLHPEDVCVSGEVPFDRSACSSSCLLVETLADDRPCGDDPSCPQEGCPAASAERLDLIEPCVHPVTGNPCEPFKRDLGTADVGGVTRRQCLVRQEIGAPAGRTCTWGAAPGAGWHYEPPDWSEYECHELLRLGIDEGSQAVLRCPRP
jgi:hypothetical protein